MTRSHLFSQLVARVTGARNRHPDGTDGPPAEEKDEAAEMSGKRENDIGPYLERTESLGICKDTLQDLARIVEKNGLATVLVGFNDYAKHLINMFPGQIVAVMDEHYGGITFRDVPVLPPTQPLPDCRHVLACDFEKIVEAKKFYAEALRKQKAIYSYAAKYEGTSTRKIDIVRQDPLLREVFSPRHRRPTSMMGEAGASQILEQLRACLMLEGDVAEIGAWQGGSAWCIAKYLSLVGSQKTLFVFDYGEMQPRDKPRSLVCEDQMRRDFSDFSLARLFFGPARDRVAEAITGRLCFVFLDFGWNNEIIPFVYERLTLGGIMLFDNYGFTAGEPDKFDTFFEAQGSPVVRTYGSTRAFVIKR